MTPATVVVTARRPPPGRAGSAVAVSTWTSAPRRACSTARSWTWVSMPPTRGGKQSETCTIRRVPGGGSAPPSAFRLISPPSPGSVSGLNLADSFPLDGARRLGRDVQYHAVDLRDSVGDPVRDRGEHLVGHPRPIGRHGVLGGDRAQHDRVAVRPPVALDPDGVHVGEEDHRALPDVPVQPGPGQLLTRDRVRGPQDLQALVGHFADDPDPEAGPRERLAPDDALGHPQLEADGPDLVLEQGAQ